MLCRLSYRGSRVALAAGLQHRDDGRNHRQTPGVSMRIAATSRVTYRHTITVGPVPDQKPIILFSSSLPERLFITHELPVTVSYDLVNGRVMESSTSDWWERERELHPVQVRFYFNAAHVHRDGHITGGGRTVSGRSLNAVPSHVRDAIIGASERMNVPAVRESTAVHYRGIRDDPYLTVPQDLDEAIAWRESKVWFVPRGAPRRPSGTEVTFAP